MTDTAASFCDVKPFDARIPSVGDVRRIARAIGGSLAVGLGAVAAVGLAVTVVTLAAAWIAGAALAPHLTATGARGLKTIALADDYPSLAGTSRFSGASAVMSSLADPTPLIPASKLARATAPDSAASRAVPVAPRHVAEPAHSAPSVPVPRARPMDAPQVQATHELAGVPDSTQVAKLTPAAAPVSALPLPRPRPLNDAQDRPAQEIARSPVEETAPQVAAAPPSPPPAPTEKRATPPQQQAHNKALALPGADSRTAVYDISARTVYMPDGAKLEAHSGLYDKMDDPRYVHVRMRGPTPPNVYDLTLREKLFHGVRAIRLNPVDEGKMFGRDGMLAHTYMLGPNGQSNGCVSFKDYDKFLNAYLKGEVDRLVVVSHLGDAPVPVATRTRRKQGNQYAAYDAPSAYISPTW